MLFRPIVSGVRRQRTRSLDLPVPKKIPKRPPNGNPIAPASEALARRTRTKAASRHTRVFHTWFMGRLEIVDVSLGRPGGPGKACQKVGCEVPHLLEGFPRPSGPTIPEKSTISGRPQKHALKTLGCSDTAIYSKPWCVKNPSVLAAAYRCKWRPAHVLRTHVGGPGTS
jgi:hypothetical protein